MATDVNAGCRVQITVTTVDLPPLAAGGYPWCVTMDNNILQSALPVVGGVKRIPKAMPGVPDPKILFASHKYSDLSPNSIGIATGTCLVSLSDLLQAIKNTSSGKTIDQIISDLTTGTAPAYDSWKAWVAGSGRLPTHGDGPLTLDDFNADSQLRFIPVNVCLSGGAC